MRIALITPVLPHPRAGLYRSIERIVEEEIRGLVARGHDLHVYTTFWNGGEAHDEYLGVPVTRVLDTATRFGRIGRLFDLDYLSFGHAAVKAILASRERYDVVQGYGRVAGAMKLRHAGMLTGQHFYHKDSVSRPVELLRVPFENFASGISYRRASLVTACSAHSRDVLIETWHVDPDRARVAYPGVNAPTSLRAPSHSPRRRVLFVGTFTDRKRPDLVVDAAPHLPNDVEFVLMGDGPMRAELQRRAVTNGVADRVRIVPPTCSDAELSDVLFDADVVVAPSDEEGFGMLVAEAMAHARPVVVSDIPALREVVGDAGILVPPSDLQAFTAALGSVLADPSRAAKLGADGRARVLTKFTWDAHLDALLAAWREAQP